MPIVKFKTYDTQNDTKYSKLNFSRQLYDARRLPAHLRGYTSRWTKIRDSFIAENPECKMCAAEGVIKLGDMVDHIKPIDEGGPKYDKRNLQTLCWRHHRIKTAEDYRRKAKEKNGVQTNSSESKKCGNNGA